MVAPGPYAVNGVAERTETSPKPILQRSEAKRWERVHQIVQSEIKAATKKFLTDRDQDLNIPVEIDLLLLGFEGDGGFGYKIEHIELEELLAATIGRQPLCPSVTETQEPANVCFAVHYYTLPLGQQQNAIKELETLLHSHFQEAGQRNVTFLKGSGSHSVQTYNVDASGDVEDLLKHMLETAAAEAGRPTGQTLDPSHRPAIVVINPDKIRMSPVALEAGKAVEPSQDLGKVSVGELLAQEAGFSYSYSYNGLGASASWLSRHNFLVIDLAAGPVEFGPTVSPSGAVTPVGLPRLMPLLARMSNELSSIGPGTLQTHMAEEAALGEHRLLVGQLVAAISSATHHVMCPDIAVSHLERPVRVLVPIVVIQDHVRFNPLDQESPSWSSSIMSNPGDVPIVVIQDHVRFNPLDPWRMQVPIVVIQDHVRFSPLDP
ncbi:MAG: hypothetical protein WDW38_005124 [Sanguina aurantia]